MKRNQKRGIWYIDIKNGKSAIELPIDFLTNGEEGELLGLDQFTSTGDYLHFLVEKTASMTDAVVPTCVELWSYLDPMNKTRDLYQEREAIYDCIFKFKTQTAYKLGYNRYGRVASRNENMFLYTTAKDLTGEGYWNRMSRYDYNWYSSEAQKVLPLGTRKGMDRLECRLSPSGRFVSGQNNDGADVYCFDSKTDNNVNLTQNLPIPFVDDEDNMPGTAFSRGLRVCGWLKDDKAVLVCDRYDIWQLDPTGRQSPINLTAGYGRQYNIRFRFWRGFENEQSGKIEIGDKIIITAFNHDTKDNGFYQIKIGYSQMPELLTMGPYIYECFQELAGRQLGMSPIKAKDCSRWIVKRTSEKESSNLFWTSDFKHFSRITNIYPEKKYQWFKTELITFITKDGIKTQAILFKPDSFDSTKKYPVLFNYYQEKSSLLHAYRRPNYIEVEDGGYYFNIPMMLSKGYLICVTDINFKVGEPAHSIIDAVEGAANYVGALPYADSNRFGISGGSFGGYATMCLAAFSSKFAAAIPVSGVCDLINAYGEIDAHEAPATENGQKRMGASLSIAPERYLRNSPVSNVNNVTVPTLMAITKTDGNVSPRQSIEYFLSLRRQRKEAWLLRYEHGSHSIGRLDQPDFYLRINQFFDHYLKGTPAPLWMLKPLKVK